MGLESPISVPLRLMSVDEDHVGHAAVLGVAPTYQRKRHLPLRGGKSECRIVGKLSAFSQFIWKKPPTDLLESILNHNQSLVNAPD
jgi:hypothetical protein